MSKYLSSFARFEQSLNGESTSPIHQLRRGAIEKVALHRLDARAKRFVEYYESTVRPLEIEAARLCWTANVTGKEEDYRKKQEAEEKVSSFGEELTASVKTSIEDMRKSYVDRHYKDLLNDCLGLLLTLYRDILVLKETDSEELVMFR